MQEYDSNRYDYKINGIISEANSYEIITDKKIQRRVGVAQLKCFGQLWNVWKNFMLYIGIGGQSFWTPPYQSVRNWLTNLLKNDLDKNLRQKDGNSKPEERTEVDEDLFEKVVAVTLKWMNPYTKNDRTFKGKLYSCQNWIVLL